MDGIESEGFIKSQTSNFRYQISDIKYQISDFRLSSTIQTLLSAPEFHQFSPFPIVIGIKGVADYHRRSGISPCPEESSFK
jgi:hypothetical protein